MDVIALVTCLESEIVHPQKYIWTRKMWKPTWASNCGSGRTTWRWMPYGMVGNQTQTILASSKFMWATKKECHLCVQNWRTSEKVWWVSRWINNQFNIWLITCKCNHTGVHKWWPHEIFTSCMGRNDMASTLAHATRPQQREKIAVQHPANKVVAWYIPSQWPDVKLVFLLVLTMNYMHQVSNVEHIGWFELA